MGLWEHTYEKVALDCTRFLNKLDSDIMKNVATRHVTGTSFLSEKKCREKDPVWCSHKEHKIKS